MTRPPLPDPELLADRQVAALMNCSTRHVLAMTARGMIPRPVKLGGRCTRWRRSDIVAAIDRLHAAAQTGGAE